MSKRPTRRSQTPAKTKRAPNERVALKAVLSAYVDLAVAVVALEEAVRAALEMRHERSPRGAIGQLPQKRKQLHADR